MIVSGILVLTAPDCLPEVRTAISALPWAEVHHTDAAGRMIVTLEAESGDDGMERIKTLKRLPSVLAAEPVLHCFEDEAGTTLAPETAAAFLNSDDDEPPRRSFYSRVKALGNH